MGSSASTSGGLLTTARAMPTDGALAHLSSLRLGLCLGLWSELPVEELARARVQIQKGHVQALSQEPPEPELMDPSERDRDRFRAEDIAALAGTGHARGTLLYMAPEVMRGGAPDVLGDLFSLGATLWHVDSGNRDELPERALEWLRTVQKSKV